MRHPQEYAFTRGDIISSDTGVVPPDRYLELTNEYCVPQSTAKFARHARDSYLVGALARINLNYQQLHPRAQQAARTLGLEPPCYNPFMNTVAQVVETVHQAEEGIDLIDRLLASGIEEAEISVPVKVGRGIGAVEAPRGLLIHDYTYDAAGSIVAANMVIPTNQNHASIQHDLAALVAGYHDGDPDELRQRCEMLVRAYDPCVSCSTH